MKLCDDVHSLFLYLVCTLASARRRTARASRKKRDEQSITGCTNFISGKFMVPVVAFGLETGGIRRRTDQPTSPGY